MSDQEDSLDPDLEEEGGWDDLWVIPLATDSDWQDLAAEMGADQDHVATQIIAHLRGAGTQSAIVEDEYLDRDFSAEYSAFYSTLFARYQRRCRRIHFFKVSLVQPDFVRELSAEIAKDETRNSYLGYVVVRPISDAPIGRTALSVGNRPGIQLSLEVRSNYEAHLLGNALKVKAIPFMQQDRRVSACAQVAMWVCGRHAHNRHGGPWKSTFDITADASNPTDEVIASSLPPGASRLGINNMLRALRAMDRQPYAYSADLDESGKPIWPEELQPEAVVARYVGSGIPVIIGLEPLKRTQNASRPICDLVERVLGGTEPPKLLQGDELAAPERDGHMVVVIGSTADGTWDSSRPPKPGSRLDWSAYQKHFLVHDDQEGVYLRMPISAGHPIADTKYNLKDYASSIIIPLPGKVFITAEVAESVAWDYLVKYTDEWDDLKNTHAEEIGGSAAFGDQIVSSIKAGDVVCRTYLTLGWRYKERLRKANAATDVTEFALQTALPRMVWVTEFGRMADLSPLDREQRRIFGHCVVDATSTGTVRRPLLLHAPGYVLAFVHTPPIFFDEAEGQYAIVSDDHAYLPRDRD